MSVYLVIIFIEAALMACLCYAQQLAVYWLVAVALSPVLLLAFWAKPTLKSSQNIFAVVFALAVGTMTLFVGTNAIFSKQFYNRTDIVFYECYFLLFAFAAFLLGVGLSRLTKQHYRLFGVGMVFAIAFCCLPQTGIALCAVGFGLLVVSAACLVASALVLNKICCRAAKILEVKNVAPQLTLRNLAFVLPAVNILLALALKLCNAEGLFVATLSAKIVCAALDFVLMFTYLRQPLDFVAERKMLLIDNLSQDIDVELAKADLKNRLNTVQNYPIAMALKKSLDILVKCETVGLENVKEDCACFIANHYEIYGPYISELKFPMNFRPWTEAAITEKESIARQLHRGIENLTHTWLAKPLREKVPYIVANPLWKLVRWARPIAVYRKGAEETDQMLEESARALLEGDSVMIYPEKAPNDENYRIGGIDRLQTGFVEIAAKYKEMCGKDMCFYPVYIDKTGKKMIVGEKVTFDSTQPLHNEKNRIANELYEKIVAIYEDCEAKRGKKATRRDSDE